MSYWSIAFPGSAEYVHEVRWWTQKALGAVPGVELVVLVASELATNAILHTASGEPGGMFTLHLAMFTNRWQVRVDDQGGPKTPQRAVVGEDQDEAGRGLTVVAALSSTWGFVGDEYARGVWADVLMPSEETA